MIGVATISTNRVILIKVDDTKTELFNFFSGICHDSLQLIDKQLVITERDQVWSNSSFLDPTILTPCNHEVAGSRITLHAAHTTQNHLKNILISTIGSGNTSEEKSEVSMSFDTGKAFDFSAVHETEWAPCPGKAPALTTFHALMGYDTVSGFAEHDKKRTV